MDEYCLDLELSQELYKRKIITDAVYWYKEVKRKVNGIQSNIMLPFKQKRFNSVCPAPILEELLEKLPKYIISKTVKDGIIPVNTHLVYFEDRNNKLIEKYDKDPKIAVAKMLIWLDDNGYLKEQQ